MTAFLAIVRVTVQQLTGRTRVLGFGLLCLLPAALVYTASRGRNIGLDTDLGALVVSPFLAFVVPITALIVAGAALGDERRDKTLSFLVLRPIGRLQIAIAKTVASSLVAVGFAVSGSFAICAVYAMVGGDFSVFAAVAAGASVAALLYAAIFTSLGNFTTRPTVVGLLYVVFIENLLVEEMPRLSPMSPWRVGLATTIDLAPDGFPARALIGGIGNLDPSLTSSLYATVAVAVVAIAVSTLRLKRTDSV